MGTQVEGIGLAYSDIYLVPQLSDISSRHSAQLDTSSSIARGLQPINLAIASANMDSVTESEMAITMAQQGGIGIIHRFMSPDQEAAQVLKVKDKMKIIEDKPPLIQDTATIRDILALQKTRNRGYFIVHPDPEFTGKFSGIVTTRDILAGKPDQKLREIMTPKIKMITAPQGTSLAEAVQIMQRSRIEKLPIVDSSGKLVGVYTLKDNSYKLEFPNASVDSSGRLITGAAIGVKTNDVERALKLVEAGVDVLVLDIAHGGLHYTKDMLHRLKIQENIKTPIIAGNVATAEGVLYLYENGADGAKVGVGPGFVCETRNIAGTGVPQVTAIKNTADALRNKQDTIPILADGGIREPGDFPKAIVLGASGIMIGSLLAGTTQSPGEPILQGGKLVSMVRGMASSGAYRDRTDIEVKKKHYTPEGRTTFTPFKGSALTTLFSFDDGLRSAMSYQGAHTIREMQDNGIYMRITSAGSTENVKDLK